jgi:two-component system NtrC family sensor kinase
VSASPNRRVLVVDDNPAIHDDFRKVLTFSFTPSEHLERTEESIFGEAAAPLTRLRFVVESAFQGQEALSKVREACVQGRPYAMVFLDVRMPPGWDGVETAAQFWQVDPEIQVVICTAYSDYSLDDLLKRLGQSDRLLILKKPFDNTEVLQLANALTEKWNLARQAHLRLADLERMVRERTHDLEQALADLRTSQDLVLRQERLAAVGQLSAGIAHEFNNIMTVIQGHANLLQVEPTLAPAALESANEIERAAKRAAGLTQQLLAFSRRQMVRNTCVDLGQTLPRLHDLLEHTLGPQSRLTCDCPSGLPTFSGDAGMIEQAVLTLARNARDAMPNGGNFHLSVRVVQRPAQPGDLATAPFLCLEARDEGCGMDAATQAHLFEPFFTTKEVGKGTGLDLAAVYGIVTQHHGRIEVESEPGRGSTFRLLFPVGTPTTPAPRPNLPAAALAPGASVP